MGKHVKRDAEGPGRRASGLGASTSGSKGVGKGRERAGLSKGGASELDEMFAAGKAKKGEALKARAEEEAGHKRKKRENTKDKVKQGVDEGQRTALDDLDDAFASGKGAKAWVHKASHTSEGYRVLWEDELGINKPGSGETELCPFDCDCCF